MEAAKSSINTILPKALIWVFLILVCIYCLIPFAWMLSTSLKTETEAFRIPPTWIPLEPTIDSYIGIWVRKNFGIYRRLAEDHGHKPVGESVPFK